MPIRFVTLDCAGTLIDVNWQPAVFAADCVERLGLPLDRSDAESVYTRLLQTRWRTYRELNLTRDSGVCDGFWRELTCDWMAAVGIEERWLGPILGEAWEGLYGSNSRVFKLFGDSLPALEALESKGLTLAALSNWDYSLHRVVAMLGLRPKLKHVIASLEEGVEKPDSGLFNIMLERLDARPDEVLHVGDDPLDDVQGALRVGWHAARLDRSARSSFQPSANVKGGPAPVVSSLREVAEVVDWIG